MMVSADLCFLSIAEASERIRKRALSPLELTEAHLARIDALDGALGSFITVTRDVALRQARAATAQAARGGAKGPLFGIPVTLKDIIATAGVRTTAASRVLKDWIPSADASVVTRLRLAGAIVLGKATLSEFTFAGGATPNDFVKAPRNPWNLELSSGGSSNGSAVGVAAGLAMASVGSDSGGSIRIPAAFCGVTGLKPTYGRIGRTGVIPLSYSMDTLGPITRDVRDGALVLEALAGYDPLDATSSRAPVPVYSRATTRPVRGLRIGTLPAYVQAVGLEADVESALTQALGVFRSLGLSLGEAKVPHLNYASAAGYNTIMRVEAFQYHFRNLRERRSEYGAAFRNIARGGFLTARDYLRAQKVRALISEELRVAFEGYDILALPVTAATPGGGAYAAEGVDVKVKKGSFSHGAAYTAPFNLTGSPTLALPAGFTRAGMPIGIQLVGRPCQEETLIAAGHHYQSSTDWHRRRPKETP
jgi:aspartyl-tRNA(Asn)/glutamyl-tRNA(Gln) amidotransferase subunit A